MLVETVDGSILESAKSALQTIKHSTGQIVRAPGQIAEGAGQIAKGAGATLQKTSYAIPIALILVAAGVGAYLLFAGRKGVNIVPVPRVQSPVELMGLCSSRKHTRRRRRS